MSNPTPAQEEFADLLAKNTQEDHDSEAHPEDRDSLTREESSESEDEEDRYRASQIDAAMRMPTFDRGGSGGAEIKLPPPSFDAGRTTGVKGVIADARSYENARRTKWKDRVRAARRTVFGGLDSADRPSDRGSGGDSEASAGDDPEEERFLQQWREKRRRELEAEARKGSIRTRRTSPSARTFGRLDTVDALGYLDAIEKVSRDAIVVVFVYDHECQVSAAIESAILPLVSAYPTVHFVKVHFEDIEFDNAGVPALLAYRDQGDLFANLTGVVEMIPDDDEFDSSALRRLLQEHRIL